MPLWSTSRLAGLLLNVPNPNEILPTPTPLLLHQQKLLSLALKKNYNVILVSVTSSDRFL